MPSKDRAKTPGRKDQSKEKRTLITEPTRPAHSAPEEVVHGLQPEIVQEHPQDAPVGWADVQEKLAASSGLALLLVDGRQPPALVASNNNSICHAFQSSLEYVSLCDPYCGDAHRLAMSAGSTVQYKCHAGLQCFTTPVQISGRQNLAAIGGRAFISGADYRSLVDRFRAGELNDLLSSKPFENVIFSEPERLDQLSERLQKATRRFEGNVQSPKSKVQSPASEVNEAQSTKHKVQKREDVTREVERPKTNDESPLDVSLQHEVDRLRIELDHRSLLAESLQRFLERIISTDPAKTYKAILTHSRELLQADRASLWVFDENSGVMNLKAAAGFVTAEAEVGPMRLGEGISGRVLESGAAMLVENLEVAGMTPAPAERNYKTQSFISYPIVMSGRRIGVLNLADKAGVMSFNEVDLSLLDIIGPQIAVALERAEWQERATQFQLMSITDPLTGLLNRRYLEERLTEELNRSQRYNYAMSCLMIDIDDFKHYNDHHGHQAGDVALKITAHALKAALRSADVACRYGGEEFCILLPQTTLSEAGVIAERMRQRVTETDYPHGRSQPLGTVSISIGISTFAKNIDTAETVIAAADRALYSAKRLGKNRLEFYVDNVKDSLAS
jgi:diguanylate cyclase (GGDEF)-like protein